jgi:plasmid stabilization system protein ParE
VIAEADEVGRPLRQILYGRRTGPYRIIFDVIDAAQGDSEVRIVRIWHGAQDRLDIDNLSDPS